MHLAELTEKQLSKVCAAILRASDIDKITPKTVRREAEKQLGLQDNDLDNKQWKVFINEVIDDYLNSERSEQEEGLVKNEPAEVEGPEEKEELRAEKQQSATQEKKRASAKKSASVEETSKGKTSKKTTAAPKKAAATVHKKSVSEKNLDTKRKSAVKSVKRDDIDFGDSEKIKPPGQKRQVPSTNETKVKRRRIIQESDEEDDNTLLGNGNSMERDEVTASPNKETVGEPSTDKQDNDIKAVNQALPSKSKKRHRIDDKDDGDNTQSENDLPKDKEKPEDTETLKRRRKSKPAGKKRSGGELEDAQKKIKRKAKSLVKVEPDHGADDYQPSGGEEEEVVKKDPPSKPSHSEDEAIKTLKLWIAKCGVRKVWAKELSGLSLDDKVTKLKRFLEDLGVKGEPTDKKCSKIRKQRELASELSALDTSNIVSDDVKETRRSRASRGITSVTTARSLKNI